MRNLDEKLIEKAKEIQRLAEKQAEREGKAYIGSLPNCEIMVSVLISPKGNRHVHYYLNGRRAHKVRIQKLIVKLLTVTLTARIGRCFLLQWQQLDSAKSYAASVSRNDSPAAFKLNTPSS